ncbi:TetR/AcrR family transcriptional regulator [Actinoplanes sp. TBRC 11911]|uniref:TetR/AcrR family transcriptional regulator n=1 Tax=Actinoplanes sp. TBRC 11911 TaxID=2729386 RepID=UPI00145F1129|nr:TetR/AcrR family transcriptional regulator [Actinoplanes sp. TBRC 11911]NMO50996.1 TetR/AcrR family transcriptional regulator [Actinoplanes sp. TBRC 11911]
MSSTVQPSQRASRSDGRRSRRTILDAAVNMATVEGLEGLSFGRLAEQVGISKSGLYAHFRSKEELQLSTIERAAQRYEAEIVGPALTKTSLPLARLEALCENFLAMVVNETFPGGCFFASANAEFDTRPGVVRDRLVDLYTAWLHELTDQYAAAQAAGQLSDSITPEHGAFKLNAYLALANQLYVMYRDPQHVDDARHVIADHIRSSRPQSPPTNRHLCEGRRPLPDRRAGHHGVPTSSHDS